MTSSSVILPSGSKTELNILLLGKTGVGKSTFINAFANYLVYETLEEIQDHDPVQALIPTSFVLYDDDGKEHKIEQGREDNTDGNESMNSLDSGTRGCKAYRFECQTMVINFIDTPGIGDTQGVDQDKKNLADIVGFLSLYKNLNAICLFMKPNEERLDAVMRYCFLELLTQLDVSAAKNILFVFTNARSCVFRPGTSGRVVTKLLEDIRLIQPEIELQFNKDHYFCFDNGAFRYLLAARNGMTFNEDEKRMFCIDWTRSRSECTRMIKHIAALHPYDVQNTLSIHKARMLSSILTQPLGDILENIIQNQRLCHEKIEFIELNIGNADELRGKLHVPRVRLELIPYTLPRIVCRSSNCTRTVLGEDGQSQTHYLQVCFEADGAVGPIGLETITGLIQDYIMNRSGLAGLSLKGPAMAGAGAVAGGAAVMALFGGSAYWLRNGIPCPNCQCDLAQHGFTRYETREVDESYEDEEVRRQLESSEDVISYAESVLNGLELQLEDLNVEEKSIRNATTKFSVFLKARAIIPCNDAFEDYINLLIQNTRTSTSMTSEEAGLLRSKLGEYKTQHLEDIRRFEEATRTGDQENVSPTAIEIIFDQLCHLKNSGNFIRSAADGILNAEMAIRGYRTIRFGFSNPIRFFED